MFSCNPSLSVNYLGFDILAEVFLLISKKNLRKILEIIKHWNRGKEHPNHHVMRCTTCHHIGSTVSTDYLPGTVQDASEDQGRREGSEMGEALIGANIY